MAGGKLPPRQKMIGMMYLVLTALLAMNISKDVLEAFVTINSSLENTNQTFGQKNNIAYSAFDKALANNKDKVKPYHDKANQVKQLSMDLIAHIEKLKIKLMKVTDADVAKMEDDSVNLLKVKVKDAYDASTNMLIGSEPAKPKSGENTAVELKQKLEAYREQLLQIAGPKLSSNLNLGLNLADGIEHGKKVSWEVKNFDHVPLAAVITVLSKLQTDVRNAESDVVKALFSEVDAADFKFDVVAAKVIAPSNYILLGDSFVADVFVAAYSSTQNPVVRVGDLDTAKNVFRGASETIRVSNGVGKLNKKATAEGLQKFGGMIDIQAPDGSIKSYPFHSEFMVAKPSAVVSPTKMNVLYIGVDNPIDISAAGVPAENLTPSMTGGTLTGSKGVYTARVTAGPKATINVIAKMGNAAPKPMGSFEFRVKRVPDPVAKFAGKTGSTTISKSDLTTALGLIADMENFDFALKFQVVSFEISATSGQFLLTKGSSGNMVSQEQKELLKSVKTGGKVYIESIKVKGEDGSLRELPPINLKVI